MAIIKLGGTVDKRHKSFAKVVRGVAPTAKNGYGIKGQFVTVGTEFEAAEGAVVLDVRGHGSMRHREIIATIYQVAGGELTVVAKYDYEKQFPTMKQALIDLLPGPAIVVESADRTAVLEALSNATEDELAAEAERRGLRLILA